MFRKYSITTESTPDKKTKLSTKYRSRNELPKLTGSERIALRRRFLEPINNIFVQNENKKFCNRIFLIRNTPAKPTLNSFFIETEKRLLDYKNRNRMIEKREISNQNKRYKQSVFSQKSLFGKFLGKDFQEKHEKLILLLGPTKNSQSNVLPLINPNKSWSRNDYSKDENENILVEPFDMRQQMQGLKQSKEADY